MIVKNCTLIKALFCQQNDTAVAVAKKLAQAQQRRIIVCDDEKPVGIISTTDINNRVVAENLDASKTTAKQIMSQLHIVCDADDHLAKIHEQMQEHSSYFVPVTQDDKLVGILTYGELSEHVQECLNHD